MPDLRKLKLRPSNRRAPKPLHPKAIQLAYLADLKRLLDYAYSLIKERLLSRLPEYVERAADHRGDTRLDALPPGKRVNTIMEQLSQAYYREFPQARLERLAEKIGTRTSDFQRDQLFKQIKSQLGVELTTLADRRMRARIKEFVAENVSLIKSLPGQLFTQVEQRVIAGMNEGLRHEEIAAQVQERFEVSEARATLIARDQVGKFYGKLNSIRQQDLGIDRFIWRTVEDNRVRPEHEELDGQEFDWAEGAPGEGIPGEQINCRCYADPVISDLLDESDEAA